MNYCIHANILAVMGVLGHLCFQHFDQFLE